MNKFTKILEQSESEKYFKVNAQIELTIKASNEGEASYIADLSLASIKNQSEYTITNINDISKDEADEEIKNNN